MATLNTLLFKQIDNSALIVFRVLFGALCFLESVGAIFTGWIKQTLIDPQFTFSFIGMERLQPLPGNWMYVYYAVMGLMGLFIMLGFKYRISIIVFTVMWAATYLMQKASYNNHYYLLILISSLMAVLPAHHYYSVDVYNNPKQASVSMPQWCKLVIVVQLAIVYTYAAFAKLYPDWLNGSVVKIFMSGKSDYVLIGELLQQEWLQLVITYGGIIFDALIVPLLLYKPTRKYAFIVSVVFHLFNSVVFQIGVFPYLSLAFSVFFFSEKTIQSLFLKHKPFYNLGAVYVPKFAPFLKSAFALYFIIQLILPIRHQFIPDNVLWTEEGHRMAWRMMLRAKFGIANYKIINHTKGTTESVNLKHYLSPKQLQIAQTKPDIMWQFAQHLKQRYRQQGDSISVYVDAKISVNGNPYTQFTNPQIDLAAVEWKRFSHQSWLMPSKPYNF